MEGIERLNKLLEEKNDLLGKVKDQHSRLDKELTTFIKSINEYDGLELDDIHCDIRRAWSRNHKGIEVRFYIYFKEADKERIAKGYTHDFGSNIGVSVYDDGIEMNYGTCGDYTSKDIGQMSRAMLIPKLWENEMIIVNKCKRMVNLNELDTLDKVNCEISQINWDIKKAEDDRIRNEILFKLRKSQYICKRRKIEDYHWDENDNYVTDGYSWVYNSHEKITKITDKSIMTMDDFWHDNHRRNLHDTITQIKNGELFLQTEKIEKEPVIEEVPA